MIGLFAQWEAGWPQQNQEKCFKLKNVLNLINITLCEMRIWSPINQIDFWLLGVFYTGKEHRLGALS